MTRCHWAEQGNELMRAYHDTQWGVPTVDNQTLFEFIVLESAQAGLSWQLILNKREGYRAAFADFDPHKVAAFTQKDVERLLQDAGIIRNRKKIEATVQNARAFLEVQKAYGSFATYMWEWVGGVPLQGDIRTYADIPAQTDLSVQMAKDLKKRGFAFLGPVVWYSHMQAVGMVNDHEKHCFRHSVVQNMRAIHSLQEA